MATLRKIGDQELVFLKYEELDKMIDPSLKKSDVGTVCARLCPLFETEECQDAPCTDGILTTKQILITFKLTGVKI